MIDLRSWDFASQGPVDLRGEWDFYWQQLLGPEDKGSAPLPLGGIWDKHADADGRRLDKHGYGSYRLRALLPPATNRPDLALRLRAVMTAHRLWVDGTELTGAGVVSSELARVRPATPNRLHVLHSDDESMQITLQVANAQFRMGGVRKPLQLGSVEDTVERHTHQIIYDAVIFTLLLAAGSYFLLVFAARSQEVYRLWFGLLCLTTAVRATVAGEALLIDILVPGLAWSSQINLEYAANFFGCALVPMMVGTLYRAHAIGAWMRLSFALGLTMVAVVLLTPPETTVKLTRVFDSLVANAALFVLIVLIRAIQARAEYAWLFLLTIIGYGLSILVDILRSNGVLPNVIEFGPAMFTALLLVQTMILARSFTRAFTANEILTKNLQLTNQAVQRFVPFEFLSLLKKSTIREVDRGDSTALEMEVLFCDLRNFASIVERLPADRAFAFINEWLSYMEPVVQRHGGFVNQYLGDCIMALFAKGADGAVAAGIEMLQANRAFSREQTTVNDDPIEVGIGLSTGPMMLGTIGGQERLDNGVVGDAVNVAARVEGMTKIYGTPFLLTASTRQRLARPDEFALRELDTVAAMGKAEPLIIYEVLDGLPDDIRAARRATGPVFADALQNYRGGRFSEAGVLFEECLSQDPSDQPARLFVDRCAQLAATPPTDWAGVTVLHSK